MGSLISLSQIEERISEARWIHWFKSMVFSIIDHLHIGHRLMVQLRPRIRISRGFRERWLRLLEIGQRSPISHCGLIVHLFVPLLELPHFFWVYGMGVVLPVEIEMRSLRVALE